MVRKVNNLLPPWGSLSLPWGLSALFLTKHGENLAPLLVKGRKFLPFWLKNNVLLESFVYFLRKLCMLALLKTFVHIFWCV